MKTIALVIISIIFIRRYLNAKKVREKIQSNIEPTNEDQ